MTKIVLEYSVNMLFISIAIYSSVARVYFIYPVKGQLLILYARDFFIKRYLRVLVD